MLKRRWAVLALVGASALLLTVLALAGCGPHPAPRAAVRLELGQQYRLADSAASKDTPGLERSPDGLLRLPRWGASQPVVLAAETQTWRVSGPDPLVLETAFGLLPGSSKDAGARFIVRVNGQVALKQEARGPLAADQIPARISLSLVPGEQAEVELSCEPLGGSPGTAVWVDPTIIAQPPKETRPNIVLIVVDAMRADHLGTYGYARNTSPWMDRLAAEGVQFQDASSHATWTLSSMLDLLTSSYPLVRGYSQDLFQRQGGGLAPVAQVAMPVSLPGELRKLGYRTYGSVGGGFIDASFGFSSGYDWYWSPPTDRVTFLDDQLAVLKKRFSDQPTDAPFFLLLHTHEVHNYLQGWGHHLRDFDRGYAGRLKDKKALFDTVTAAGARGLSPADLQYLRDLYDGEIRCTDQSLGKFIDWLASGSRANTVVMLTADHGEAFGEHGLLHHGLTPYRQVSRVPLIIRLLGQQYHGRRATEPVGHMDVMPTLLELAGGKPPAGILGESLVPLMAGRQPGTARPILCEGRRPVMSAREGRWAYITWLGAGREELYDVAADPEERVNLAPSRPADLAHMRRVLAEQVARGGRGYRLFATGRRPQAMTVEFSSDAGFNYFLYPTSPVKGAIWGNNPEARVTADPSQGTLEEKRVVVTLPAGEAPQVILFEGADPKRPVRVTPQMGGTVIPGERVFLGREGRHPSLLPLDLRPDSRASGITWTKPPALPKTGEWGLWVWLLDTQTGKAPGKGAGVAGKGIPEDVRKQLKSLGYTD